MSIFLAIPELISALVAVDRAQSVNAAHEFRINVKPVEEEYKDHVGIRIHFK